MKQMKYLKLFEAKSDKKFWVDITADADYEGYAGDEIYAFESGMEDAETFEDFLGVIRDATDLFRAIEGSVEVVYIDRLKKHILNFPGSPIDEEKLKIIFEGIPNSKQWAHDGTDPIVGYEDIYEIVSNEYVNKFILNMIFDKIDFEMDKLVEFIKEDPTNYKTLIEETFEYDDIQNMLIEKLKQREDIKHITRGTKTNLFSFEK